MKLTSIRDEKRLINTLVELEDDEADDSGFVFSLKINPSSQKKTLINFIKLDFNDQTKQDSYEQILRYNDYENLIKLFHKEQRSTVQDKINLEQSMVLFDFIMLVLDFDREGGLTSQQHLHRLQAQTLFGLPAPLAPEQRLRQEPQAQAQVSLEQAQEERRGQ